MATILKLLSELESLLKLSAIENELARHDVNAGIVLATVRGIVAYLQGDKLRAIEDLATAAEQIESRLGG